MYCPKCGTYNEDSYRFCLSCGTELFQQASGELDHMTSDGRYIIEPDDCNTIKVAYSQRVASSINNKSGEGGVQAETDGIMEMPLPESTKTLNPTSDETSQTNTKEEDVVVLRKIEPIVPAPVQVTRITSSTKATTSLPRGFRILLACCAVLVLWIVLSVVIIPGLNLRKQGAIIQVVVMGSAFAVIKACWKTIIGDKSKSNQ